MGSVMQSLIEQGTREEGRGINGAGGPSGTSDGGLTGWDTCCHVIGPTSSS
jgi:hypothetical protein